MMRNFRRLLCIALAAVFMAALLPAAYSGNSAKADSATLGMTILSDVNFRIGPSMRESMLFKLPKNTVCPVLGQVTNDGYTWYKVTARDPESGYAVEYTGYLRGDCFRMLTDAEAAAYNAGSTTPVPSGSNSSTKNNTPAPEGAVGTINNYGKYDDVIAAQDPDKGNINYHKGIQITWKDNVTVLDEATQTYSVNPDVVPGTLFIGSDAEGNKNPNAQLNNYGDIVLVPGVLNIDAQFNNLAGGEVVYSAHLDVCAVTEAVVPIQPDPSNPTQTEERRPLAEPYPSVINRGDTAVINNQGVVTEASVQVSSNGVLGELTELGVIEI